MQTVNIEEKVKEIICEIGSIEIAEEKDQLKKDLGLDSLSLVSLLIAVENGFSIELEESDLDPASLITVGDIYRLVGKYSS